MSSCDNCATQLGDFYGRISPPDYSKVTKAPRPTTLLNQKHVNDKNEKEFIEILHETASENMMSQLGRARKTRQHGLGAHAIVRNSRQQAFKAVKDGLTEIKKNLTVNRT